LLELFHFRQAHQAVQGLEQRMPVALVWMGAADGESEFFDHHVCPASQHFDVLKMDTKGLLPAAIKMH